MRLGRQLLRRRAFATSVSRSVASNLNMPALSPTMTSGQISIWKVKRGDNFGAGDVILEVETDKAQMDVEAQDDGLLAKILVEAGGKQVQVGETIAVLAEQGDNLSTLEIPEPEGAPKQAQEAAEPERDEGLAPKQDQVPASGSQMEETKPSITEIKQVKSPVSPAVLNLLTQFDIVDPSHITGTGPKGRILKGDVLAYAGKISSERPREVRDMEERLGQLDLSNINIRPAVAATAKHDAEATKQTALPPKTIEAAIVLDNLLKLQAKLSENIAVDVPINMFITRAASRAYEEVPYLQKRRSLSDSFFDDLLSRSIEEKSGNELEMDLILPTNIPTSVSTDTDKLPRQDSITVVEEDIIDILSSNSASTRRDSAGPIGQGEIDTRSSHSDNIMTASLGLAKVDEERALAYLERFKYYLENPGTLLL